MYLEERIHEATDSWSMVKITYIMLIGISEGKERLENKQYLFN